MLSERVRNNITQHMKLTLQSRQQVAAAAGIGYNTLNVFLRGDGDTSLSVIESIASALGVPVENLITSDLPEPSYDEIGSCCQDESRSAELRRVRYLKGIDLGRWYEEQYKERHAERLREIKEDMDRVPRFVQDDEIMQEIFSRK